MTTRRDTPASDDRVDVDVDEITLPNEEWPIAAQYRIEPAPEPAGDEVLERRRDEGSTKLVTRSPAPPRAQVRRFPPDTGLGFLVALIAALVLVPAAVWLATAAIDDSEATPPAASPTNSGGAETNTTAATDPTTPTSESVPDVTGLMLSEARSLLQEAGFRVRIRRVASEQSPGEILRQLPSAGTDAAANSAVVLTVSAAPEHVIVPAVTGLTAAEATRSLRDAGLEPEIRLVRSTEPAGTVLDQAPDPAEEVAAESVVRLEVAAKPARVEVPRLIGLTASAARSELRNLGLRWTMTGVESQQPEGAVVGQSPRAGTELRKTQEVVLRVSTGPTEVAVPNVIGLDEQSARRQLEAAGFEVRVADQPTVDVGEDGLVVSQDPAGGIASEKSSVVTLTVARFS